jgi:hypothetical protein
MRKAVTGFRSNEELFQAVRDLIATLESGDHPQAAATLRDGLGCLNGLTDGWALFLEAIDAVQASAAKQLAPADRKALKALRAAAHAAVYRR